MSELFIRPVQRASHAIDIASVRNTGREFMTHDTAAIEAGQQERWFERVYLPAHHEGKMFAFAGYADDVPAAYGMVQKLADEYWLTGVVHPEYQGLGYGQELFEFLTGFALNRANHVMLDVREDNVKAQALYRKLGFTAFSESNGVIVMRKLGGVA